MPALCGDLCGASFGGVVAFEMARRLVAEGEEVKFLGLFDSYGGEYPKHRKSLALRKRLKVALLRFFPHARYITFSLAWLKSGLKEQMKRWFVRRMIALDELMKFRALRFSRISSKRVSRRRKATCDRQANRRITNSQLSVAINKLERWRTYSLP